MRLFIILLIFAAFIQTSFWHLNLCLVLIITRTFLSDRSSNYHSAFVAGIFLGVLSTTNLGFWPLIFVLSVKIISAFKKLPFSSNFLTILPISFVVILVVNFAEAQIFSRSFNISKVIFEALLIVPIYLPLKFWEERFIVKPDIRLKIKEYKV